tara:strand:+ start:19259 stop:19426 length:168 start_codon:yes stop_codon:yes gene_type:complete
MHSAGQFFFCFGFLFVVQKENEDQCSESIQYFIDSPDFNPKTHLLEKHMFEWRIR